MTSIYLQHNETGQLAKLTGSQLTIIRRKTDGFLLPGPKCHIRYEVAVIDFVSSEYIDALCKSNVSMGKRVWDEKVSSLISVLIK